MYYRSEISKINREYRYIMKSICIVNQKGGVGKTTTAINLAAGLARIDRKVLLIDMDPQANASSGLNIKKEETIYHALIGQKSLSDVVVKTSIPNLNLVPANSHLAGAEVELVNVARREGLLSDSISHFIKHQSQKDSNKTSQINSIDYILIDAPPSLNLLTINALTAANSFIVPLQCEYYALEGLSQLLNTASLIKTKFNPELRMQGILFTMFDVRNKLSHQIISETKQHFSQHVFRSVIPRNVKLSEAPSHGLCIFDYDPRSVGAVCYQKFAEELDEQVHYRLNSLQKPMNKNTQMRKDQLC